MFSVIASSGHAGTKWLAAVLNSQKDVIWHHHLREQMTGKGWEKLDLISPRAPIFERYWERIRSELNVTDVGDSNSWPPHSLPAVNSVQHIDRVIYMTRNGIQQLHSLMTTSPALSKNIHPPVAMVKFEALYDAMPEKPDKPFDEWSNFEHLCLMVAANNFMPDWLRDKGLVVDVYSLEDLTTELDMLRELAPGLDEYDLNRWQQTDINRKVTGKRTEAAIWRKWTKEQRAAYKEIVG